MTTSGSLRAARPGLGPLAVPGALAVAILLLTLLGPLAAPHDPLAVDLTARFEPSSLTHPLGTDHLGRDILSRLIAGARTTLGAVAAALALVVALGLGVGAVAGMLGGRTDAVLMRLCDVFLTVPTFVLALFLIGAFGTGLVNVIAAIALSHWAWYARIVRGLVLELKTRDYVLAARIAGAAPPTIFVEHVLTGVLPPLVALATLDIGHMALHVAGLSFLGLGVQPPTPEWGVMINEARAFFWTRPLLVVWPGLAIALAVLAFNRLGDALRDRLDPTLVAERGL
ncbi:MULTISPECIES: nickel ABC transporter permease subunit NikC [Methylobacterium]|jgi:nickel transport system permease protein|uniref:Nickel ABC transporter permease subunit NikC n=1 Tax=Methylobacterium longum TaxID=767694 RepID=A0ABT8AL08_9HYPH|nr:MULTISPECIES: nickel ABC transporter permease subunit NikC [Methylobacterium]MCJ2102023.1 nickel ABC transporter permease subunit NikC [Methylobacterium sp. E-046]MDN3570110.1 nickel ABC transporter permease subunit NikC [Methylobacterium longum]GJE12184.1 Nickel transport system permease protein NikC [Methylobacterium longum]